MTYYSINYGGHGSGLLGTKWFRTLSDAKNWESAHYGRYKMDKIICHNFTKEEKIEYVESVLKLDLEYDFYDFLNDFGHFDIASWTRREAVDYLSEEYGVSGELATELYYYYGGQDR